MSELDKLKASLPVIEEKIQYGFRDKNLLLLAFLHRSFMNENKGLVEAHNERLEFLGDAVLGLLVSDYLFRSLPHVPEGELSALRARLVEASSCASYVYQLHLDSHVLLGKGERMNDGRGRESILADLFEAVVAAIYLDGGFNAASQFLFTHFQNGFNESLKNPSSNWKALLQDYSQKKFQQPPSYVVLSEVGPDHSKQFEIAVLVNGRELGRGMGPSKKEAQQAAARDAWVKVGDGKA